LNWDALKGSDLNHDHGDLPYNKGFSSWIHHVGYPLAKMSHFIRSFPPGNTEVALDEPEGQFGCKDCRRKK
jgi:hypothetical protein